MTTGSKRDPSVTRRWANLRFSIIGPLMAAPPDHGELAAQLAELAAKTYQHPTTGEAIRYSVSTIERWYYAAKDAADPVAVLARKVPSHAGTYASMSARLAVELEAQYRAHPGWTFQLHHDNLLALIRERPELGPAPGYTTTRRYMKHRGWLRHRKKRRLAADLYEQRETRSFEVSHVHALWHADFHDGSRKILTAAGEWKTPVLFGVLDDRSRLCCHVQWYLVDECAEIFIHGLSQAIAKRGLPRALLTDNGSAMIAGETAEGLARLGVVHHTTLPYTPEQNAKQEVFWAQVEGRLVPMLEGERELSLALLNTATQAWAEGEYQRKRHDELGCSPLERALEGSTSRGQARRRRTCAARFVSRPRAPCGAPTARLPSRESASNCRGAIARSVVSPSASRAGICPRSISSIRDPGRTSCRSCRSTRSKTPTGGDAPCRSRRRSTTRHRRASRRTCVG
jgi:putative transposase